ncbi:Translation initiation factor IF-1 [Anaerolineae bacterium]|nr:translation initiation factor IF-1 [Sandaracinaceae bacterium]MCC6876245.1 translation initiation factor IF-1 [Sandaracinaceae bacterium]CAG0953188.1 Translation initiation factor IF-1 [Anaerolineae bacterium]
MSNGGGLEGSVLEGKVEEALPRGLFAVRCDDGRRVVATLSTAARRVIVKIIPGDRVLVELSAFDPSRGRIKARLD